MANVIKLKRGTSTPTTSNIVDGEVAIDKTAKKLYVNDGSTIKEIGGGLQNVVEDTTPQLGGNLDVQSSEITTSTSNGNIKLNPNGTGVVEVKGDGSSADGTLQLNCSQNSHGIKLKSPPHSASASYTLTFPNTDGSSNQVLKTDGSGGLDWVDQSSGGLSSDAQQNTVGGTNAGDSFTGTDASDNTLIGFDAGTALTTGDKNTVTGSGCGDSMTTTNFNTGMGYQALSSLTTGSQHVAIGDWASKNIVTGNYSTAVGSRALFNATAGFNSAFGNEALYACTSGDINTAIGQSSLKSLTTGARNNALGYNSGENVTTGQRNTYLGEYAGTTATTGSRNICIGSYSQPSSATVSNEITLGDSNVDKFRVPGINFTVKDSTATEDYVLTVDANGECGWEAAAGGGLSSDAQFNTVGGTNAGDSFSGSSATNNTLIGYAAGTSVTSGDYNNAFGSSALYENETGSQNVAIGDQAGYNVTGSRNVMIGHQASVGGASGATSISDVIAIGYRAGMSNQSGNYNVFVGRGTGELTTSGGRSVLIGYLAGQFNSTADDSVGLGNRALNACSTGSKNSAIGSKAGLSITSGTNNTILGADAGDALTTGGNNLILGYNAAASGATVSNEITLGNSSVSSLRCNTQTISSLSDRRDKTEVNTLDLGLEFIDSLSPVKFKWETRDGNGKDGSYEAGFIAQDFQQVQKDNDADYLGLVMDSNPDRLEASYGKLVPILVKAIQELKMEIETLKTNG